MAYVFDRADEHGGDLDSLMADLRNKLQGTEIYVENDDLSQASLFAIAAVAIIQEVENGFEQVRKIRDKHRLLAADVPRQRAGWRGWDRR